MSKKPKAKKVDAIIFSPPFSEQQAPHRGGGNIGFVRPSKDGKIGTDEKDKCWFLSEDLNNIGNLKHGEIDAIVFSPPYSEKERWQAYEGQKGFHSYDKDEARNRCKRDYQPPEKPENIGNLPHGKSENKNPAQDGENENVLFFKPTPGFQGYEQFFHPDAVTHPAKANLNMLRWIIERFTKEGEVVLDPMAGTGSTGVMAAHLNRRAVCIDLEQKFVDMTNKNNERFREACKFWNVERPEIVAMQGDSRQLSEVLSKVDSIIFSPPYSESHQVADPKFYAKALHDLEGRNIKQEKAGTRELSENPENISNLPHGKIDTIVTSPPYAETISKAGGETSKYLKPEKDGCKVGESSSLMRKYSETPQNVANLPKGEIDAIVTSPPYELSMEGGSRHHPESEPHYKIVREKRAWNYYSDDKTGSQLGNLSGETYLSAMLKVYRECRKVLKPNGLMVIIIKNFIRNKQIIRLDLDTIKLCQKAGFRLAKRFKAYLGQQSFWRIIYHQKYPNVPKIKHEHILVFQKT